MLCKKKRDFIKFMRLGKLLVIVRMYNAMFRVSVFHSRLKKIDLEKFKIGSAI